MGGNSDDTGNKVPECDVPALVDSLAWRREIVWKPIELRPPRDQGSLPPASRGVRLLRRYQRDAVKAVLGSLDPAQCVAVHIAAGGGSTKVANVVLTRWAGAHAGPVLWVTKDWRGLGQAVADLRAGHMVPRSCLGRIGRGTGVLAHLDEATDRAVVYSTLRTFLRRSKDGLPDGFKPSLVVWDGCHWDDDAKPGRRLVQWCQQRGMPVFALMAKSRPPADCPLRVVYRKELREIERDGYLPGPSSTLSDPPLPARPGDGN